MAKNDLMHGNTSLLVLSLIEQQDMYGYQIIKELKRKSENVFELKEGSLYPVLHALENEKLITSYIEDTDSARKRRYYSITDKGRKELADKKEEFFTFTTAARKVLSFAWGGVNMTMRKFYSFKDAKEIYIERVLYHIHYGRLKKRIKEEIENHMDDMYNDFKNDFDNELDIAKKVVDEMGDPDELGLKLKKANKRILFISGFFKRALIVFVIVFAINISEAVIKEVRPYIKAENSSTIQEAINQEHYSGKGKTELLTEIEHNDIIYRVYVTTVSSHNYIYTTTAHSITLFGIPVKNKFISSGGTGIWSLNATHFVDIDEELELAIYFGNDKERYLKCYYEPIDSESKLDAYWSDFIELPQDASTENPKYLYLNIPKGYNLGKIERFNENKEPAYQSS